MKKQIQTLVKNKNFIEDTFFINKKTIQKILSLIDTEDKIRLVQEYDISIKESVISQTNTIAGIGFSVFLSTLGILTAFKITSQIDMLFTWGSLGIVILSIGFYSFLLIRAYKLNNRLNSFKFVRDLVSKYTEIVDDLKSKGGTGEVLSLDNFYTEYKSYENEIK